MPNVGAPPDQPLPSSRSLVRSTVTALAAALLILVTVVLPAEYGIDPTGIGRIIGLKRMGEIKVALAREAAADAAADAAAAAADSAAALAETPSDTGTSGTSALATQPAAASRHEERIALSPGQGKEVKLEMRRAARVSYSWATDRGVVNYDTHGDSVNAPRGFYHGYGKGTGARADSGVLVAAFDGMHGWFWRNRTTEVVTVILRTEGDYQALKYLK